MSARCTRHPFEVAEAICEQCGEDFCGECLVYVHGQTRPPFCIPCALVLGGIRHRPRTKAAYRPARAAVVTGHTIESDDADVLAETVSPTDAESPADGPAVQRRPRPKLVGILAVAAGSALIVLPSVMHMH